MATVAELSVLVGADITGLRRGLNEANESVDKYARDARSRFVSTKKPIDEITSSLDRLSSTTSRAAGNLAGVFLPAGLALGYGVSVAASFEDSLTELSVRTQTYGDDLDLIREKALQLGQDTAFSAQQSLDAFLQLVTSGSTVEEAFAQIGPVLDAAAASGEDLGRTADIVTDIMAAFQLAGDTIWEDGSVTTLEDWTGYVVDSLARAAGASSATMGDLGEGFANVGGLAKGFGLDVFDTAAILAIFSENGIKGAEAGTQLKSMLQGMDRDTADVKAAWNTLGTSMYDAAGNMRPLEAVLEDIRLGMDGRTEQEQNAILQDLAGSYGVLGLRALLGGVSIGEMQAKMEESASATEVAEARMSTFSGSFDQLKGSIETFMITAGTPFIENVLQPAVGHLTNIVTGITAWADENPDLATGLMTVVGGGVLAVPILWGISAAAGAAKTMVGGLAAVVGFLGVPGTLGVLGLAGAFVVLNTEVGDGVTVFDTLKFGAIAALDDIGYNLRKAQAPDEEIWLFNVTDRIVNELTAQFGTGQPLTLSPMLEFQIDQDPVALAETMGYQARTVLVAAWNQAAEDGNLDFLKDVAPLVAALDHLSLIPSELGDLNTEPLQAALRGAFNENVTEIGNAVIKPGDQLPVNVSSMYVLLEGFGEDPNLLTADIESARIIAALNMALADAGTLELDVPVSLTAMPDGTYTSVTLEDLLRGVEFSPEFMQQVADNASADMIAALKTALVEASINNDQNALKLLMPLAIELGIDDAALQAHYTLMLESTLASAEAAKVTSDITVTPSVDGPAVASAVRGQIAAQDYDTAVTAVVTVNPIYDMQNPDTGMTFGIPMPPMIDGSHAGGLDRVPFDGYRAVLHRDEAVLTAADATAWRAMRAAPADVQGGGTVINISVPLQMVGQTPREAAMMIKRELESAGIGAGVFS